MRDTIGDGSGGHLGTLLGVRKVIARATLNTLHCALVIVDTVSDIDLCDCKASSSRADSKPSVTLSTQSIGVNSLAAVHHIVGSQ